MKIAQHAHIEAVLALELSLTETLARLGLTHERHRRTREAKGHKHTISENGREVYRGDASETWSWLRAGCPAEGEQC